MTESLCVLGVFTSQSDGVNMTSWGSDLLVTRDGGSTWTDTHRRKGANSLACPTTTMCVGVSEGKLVRTTDAGATWSDPVPLGDGFARVVTCPDGTHCFATGYAGNDSGILARSSDGGVTWQVTYSTKASFAQISCSSSSVCTVPKQIQSSDDQCGYDAQHQWRCYATGEGVVYRTTNGGANWTAIPMLSGIAYTYSVACPDRCLVGAGDRDWRASMLAEGSPAVPECVAAPAATPPSGRVSRVQGQDRAATAVAASQSQFPAGQSASAAVLASGEAYPDGLAGAPLAASKHGPLLLTHAASLDSVTASELTRVLPAGATVYVLGGAAAIAPDTEASVKALGFQTSRVAGSDRYATAVAIASVISAPSVIVESTGTNFPDALSAGAGAAHAGGVLLLTEGSVQSTASGNYIAAPPSVPRVATGGAAASADPHARPLVGADRWETSVKVAAHFFPDAPSYLGFASGATFPDALAASTTAAAAGGPVVLVPACGTLPGSIAGYLTSGASNVGGAQLFGGTSAVGDDVLQQLDDALSR
jgi:putative cell wall-binding protein